MCSLMFLGCSILMQAGGGEPSKAAAEKSKPAEAEKSPAEKAMASFIGGLSLRSIGPALTSGRLVTIAVHPKNNSEFYVGAASGGLWKTSNAGVTWTPIFDDQPSYSIGCAVIDPKNSNVVWVGTGENNSQRSVGYGDGVYVTEDAGKTWRNVGLKKSEHIGRIVLDPRDSNTVYVAAQGPLWGPGGDRGLYKTTDAGKNWNKVLAISDNTGVTDLVLHPNKPDVLLAASYQRRRHVWTLINGGPESALHRSTDGGKTWKKITSGLPAGELGRIGLASAPSQPEVVYAIVESTEKKGGIFRSDDFGVTWQKQNDFDEQAQYYAHIVVDPVNADRLYVMNVMMQVSDDAGKTLRPLGEKSKHVDNHCIWINPTDNTHYRVGCDGGLYETFDRGATYRFHENLPITQFYDIACDQDTPFYNVYGGTQDNFTLGGPARNNSIHGICNHHWFVVQGGDGFHCKVDPQDSNIVYAESQYGGLVRFDRRTGLSTAIQPQPAKGEEQLRWNWDSPLVLSPHQPKRLYFAANKVFRSEDRGDSWKAVSGDVTRKIDRNTLEVMGKVWGPDAVSKSVSTSLYGNVTALAESPVQENLLYAGTDDGLIQISQTGAGPWRKVEKFPGVPDRTYVTRILASHHNAKTVYAAFDNHKNADFKPYLLKSTDAGETWTSISANLPENGAVLALAEDHIDPNLLFVGVEFGLHVTLDGGKKWTRLKAGLPTIPVRDLAIHKKLDDLVVGTFGRGFYILDDYSPLRKWTPAGLEKPAVLYTPKAAYLTLPNMQFGGTGKGFLGETLFTAPNPAYGAVFTYHLKDSIKSRKDRRRDAEKESAKKKQPTSYPTPAELRSEVDEPAGGIALVVRDKSGTVVRVLTGSSQAGLHRVDWDLRETAATLPAPAAGGRRGGRGGGRSTGPFAQPGAFTVTLVKRVGGKETPLADPAAFVVHLDAAAKPVEFAALREFQLGLRKLSRAFAATMDASQDAGTRLDAALRALDAVPELDAKWRPALLSTIQKNKDIQRALRGDEVMRGRNENSVPSVQDRLGEAAGPVGYNYLAPTKTAQESWRLASDELAEQVAALRKLIEKDLSEVEADLDRAGAPPTPGRLPIWSVKEK